MSKNLVIVESPAKAKTIKKYLGKDFEVLASYGHVRDLIPKEGAVDPAQHFAMRYQVIDKNQKHVDKIRSALEAADALFLATDPDREGEAISWHLYELLHDTLGQRPVQRVVFHEITQKAVQDAVNNPRQLSMDLVNAQQARRALDYLVGFNLSPLLWKKIRRGLSAGRVQSPALRMIVEREEEIERFQPREYWTLTAHCQHQQLFPARLAQYQGQKVEQFSVCDQATATAWRSELLKQAAGQLVVQAVERKQRKRNPAPPFTTSTLQQEAARKLGFSTQRTMRTAQQLYEGVDVGSGSTGLITYMRTDSVNLAAEALEEIRALIKTRYGAHNLPAKPRQFKTKAKNAQEAHEAVRPTSAARDPDSIKAHLTADQFRLYELIWKRTVACQMIAATLNTLAIDLACAELAVFRATGSTIADPGFMAVYREDLDEVDPNDDEGRILPELSVGDRVELLDVLSEQHFTEPPPRFSEASVVKALEEYGIGRPSTYATIISTLLAREYVQLDKRRFVPTDIGRIVNRFLTQHFERYVDYDFTAKLEDELDAVSRGEKDWLPVMDAFWQPFKQLVDDKETSVTRAEVTSEALDEACPKCGKPLSIRLGKRGRFIGCTGYPECDYTRGLDGEEAEAPAEPEVVEGRTCPKCDSPLIIRQGRFGKFIGCSNYPKCKFIEPLEKPKDSGVTCPECGKGTLIEKKSRYGKLFYSCSTYPSCKYAVWNPPIAEACPKCQWPVLTIKTTKRRGTEKVCPQKDCGYSEVIAAPGAADTTEE